MVDSGLLECNDEEKKDLVLIRKRSDHCLKGWNVTTDTRAWILNGEGRCKYTLNLLNKCVSFF